MDLLLESSTFKQLLISYGVVYGYVEVMGMDTRGYLFKFKNSQTKSWVLENGP